jgi:hypothetical protein
VHSFCIQNQVIGCALLADIDDRHIDVDQITADALLIRKVVSGRRCCCTIMMMMMVKMMMMMILPPTCSPEGQPGAREREPRSPA